MTFIEAARGLSAEAARTFYRLDRFATIQAVGGHVLREPLLAKALGQRDSLRGGHAGEPFTLLLLELVGKSAAHLAFSIAPHRRRDRERGSDCGWSQIGMTSFSGH